MMYAISSYIVPRYNGTRLYMPGHLIIVIFWWLYIVTSRISVNTHNKKISWILPFWHNWSGLWSWLESTSLFTYALCDNASLFKSVMNCRADCDGAISVERKSCRSDTTPWYKCCHACLCLGWDVLIHRTRNKSRRHEMKIISASLLCWERRCHFWLPE